jgi:hypothetical protein
VAGRALGELLEGQGSLIIRHVDRLSAVQVRACSIALEQAVATGRQETLWVVLTLSQGRKRTIKMPDGAARSGLALSRRSRRCPNQGRKEPMHRDVKVGEGQHRLVADPEGGEPGVCQSAVRG